MCVMHQFSFLSFFFFCLFYFGHHSTHPLKGISYLCMYSSTTQEPDFTICCFWRPSTGQLELVLEQTQAFAAGHSAPSDCCRLQRHNTPVSSHCCRHTIHVSVVTAVGTPSGMGIKNGKVSWKVGGLGAAEGSQWGSGGKAPWSWSFLTKIRRKTCIKQPCIFQLCQFLTWCKTITF